MIAISIEKVKSIHQKLEFKDRIEKQRINAISNLSKITVTNNEDKNYLEFVKQLFNDNADILTWNPSKLNPKNNSYLPVPTIENSKKQLVKSEIKNKILKKLGYKELRKSFYPEYFREVGIKSCVYCNSQLAITAVKSVKKGFSAKFEVDHYHSKDEYPFLSICLFNLYPSCASCNRAKSKNDCIEFDLYINDLSKIKKSEYKFHLQKHSKANYLINKDPKKLDFHFEEPQYSKEKKTFNEIFSVNGIYKTQLDVIEDLIAKSQIYNHSYLNLLKKNFDKLNLNPELFKRSLIGAYTKDEDIHKRPMNKFIMDIAKDLDLIE